jgi:hypothetical protein
VREHSGPLSLNLQLWYGDVLVADMLGAKPHQGTWFALYRQLVAPDQGEVERRLCEFIAFCERWHQRLGRGEAPDAREFDQFEDLIESGSWRVPCSDGTVLMTEAPIFAEGEVSWNHPESRPSREAAAERMWSQLTKYCT